MTVRELCKAHGITTLDEQDALLLKLAQDRDALLAACKEFVRKCDSGQARSIRSYAEMSAAIAQAEAPARWCSWCQKLIAPGDPSKLISHGIHEACRPLLEREIA